MELVSNAVLSSPGLGRHLAHAVVAKNGQRHGAHHSHENPTWLVRAVGSAGVRLGAGCRVPEGASRHAALVDRHQRWKGRGIALESQSVEDLRHQAAVGERRLVTDTEGVGRISNALLDSCKSHFDPVLVPTMLFRFVDAHLAGEVLQHSQIAERVDFASDVERQGADEGALQRRAAEQRRLGMDFVQVLDDCERLAQRLVAVSQHRNQRHRVDGAHCVVDTEAQIHRDRLPRQPLQVQRDADAERCRAAEVGVKLQHGASARARQHGAADLAEADPDRARALAVASEGERVAVL